MNYLADTVALIHYLWRPERLGAECRRILREAEQGQHHVLVSAISLMEVLYLAEAQRISVPLSERLVVLRQSRNFSLAPVDAVVVEAAVADDDVPELHDRTLVGTALAYGVAILTSERVIAAWRHAHAVWA